MRRLNRLLRSPDPFAVAAGTAANLPSSFDHIRSQIFTRVAAVRLETLPIPNRTLHLARSGKAPVAYLDAPAFDTIIGCDAALEYARTVLPCARASAVLFFLSQPSCVGLSPVNTAALAAGVGLIFSDADVADAQASLKFCNTVTRGLSEFESATSQRRTKNWCRFRLGELLELLPGLHIPDRLKRGTYNVQLVKPVDKIVALACYSVRFRPLFRINFDRRRTSPS